jgi:hypothetical protein
VSARWVRNNPHATTVFVLAAVVALIGCAVLIGRGVWGSLVSNPDEPSLRVTVPAAVTTADGVPYRLVAQARVFTGAKRTLAFTADAGASPVVAVRASCALAGSASGRSTMDLQVAGAPDFYTGDPTFSCPISSSSLREFPTAQLPHTGSAVRIDLSERASVPGPAPTVPASWLFAVYVRVGSPSSAPAAPVLPPVLYDDSVRLTQVSTYQGAWPADRRLAVTLAKGHAYTVVVACSPVMAGRSAITMTPAAQADEPCPGADQAPYRDEIDAREHEKTITVRFSVADADLGHAGSWVVAVYRD